MALTPKKDATASNEEEIANANEDSSMSSADESESADAPKKTPVKDNLTNGESEVKPRSEKRERKKVESYVSASPATVPKKLDLDQGSGVPLDDIPYISHMINTTKSEDLKNFHKILFQRPGSGHEIKRNIRKFKGYNFKKDDEKFQDLKGRIDRLKSKSMLTAALNIVGLNVTGNREELAERLANFLVSPTMIERGIPKKKRGKKLSGKKKTKARGAKGKDAKSKRKSVSKKETSEESASESESPGEESASEAETENKKKRKREEEDEGSDEESSEPETKKKTPAKRGRMSTKEKENSVNKVNEPSSKKAKKTKPAKKTQNEEDESGSSDEEFLIKKVKPTDGDIETFIKTYMKSVNLEEVTMKNIYQKVNGEYPNVDLASKKDFIKSTVKQILAA